MREQTTCNTYLRIDERKILECKVCKSVHHHTIQINHQLDATLSPVYYFTFMYSSTCFGRPHAHYQELNNCSSSLWFYLQIVVVAVLLVVVDPAGPCYHHAPKVKPEAATAVVELVIMGVRTPETC
jgi:hypothetical protein